MAHQYGNKASHARVQIHHVNALLADQLVWQHNQPVSIQTLPLDENKNRSLIAAADIDQFGDKKKSLAGGGAPPGGFKQQE